MTRRLPTPGALARVVRGRGRQGLLFLVAQGVAQLLGIVTGVLMVRWLAPGDYAEFALVSSLSPAFAVAAEGGIAGALLSATSRVEPASDRFTELVAAAFRVRLALVAVVAVVGAPVLLVLLVRLGASGPSAALLTLLGVCLFAATATNTLLQTVLQASLDFSTTRIAAGIVAALRLLASSPLNWVPGLGAAYALLASLASTVASSVLLRRRARVSVRAVLPADRARMNTVVRQVLPFNLAIIAHNQALFVILSILGQSRVLGEVAALSRYAAVFVLLQSTLSGYLVPVFSKVAVRALPRTYLVLALGYVAAVGAALAVIAAASHWLLYLLGRSFLDDGPLMITLLAGSGAYVVVDGLNQMNQARGWIGLSWTFAPFALVWSVLVLLLVDVSTLWGAAIFSATTFVPGLAVNLLRLRRGLRTPVPEVSASLTP